MTHPYRSIVVSLSCVPPHTDDIKIITYRDHHNAFSKDDKNVTYVDLSQQSTPFRRFMQFFFSIVMVHYFLWIFAMVGLLYFFYWLGAWPISILLLGLYIPTFLNGDQYKKGRPWHWFRMHKVWRLTSRYIGIEVVRTKVLDPTKKVRRRRAKQQQRERERKHMTLGFFRLGEHTIEL